MGREEKIGMGGGGHDPHAPKDMGGRGALEMTFAMIKPDAVERRIDGVILRELESAGVRIRGMRIHRLLREEAEYLYAEHASRDHFRDLIDFTVGGPVVLLCLEGEGAVARLRQLIGHSDPARAGEGTIRARHAETQRRNCIHASDGPEAAKRELLYFFRALVS